MRKEPTAMMETMGQRIRDRRHDKRLKLRELAERIGMSIAHLSLLETGQVETRAGLIVRICHALGVSADWLLGI